jgi:murein DD-endopeptidase MepM/ murein hydrolase activator NlpD
MYINKWMFPLPLKNLGETNDSMSFKKIDITKECEIPMIPNGEPVYDDFGRQHHCGAFGVKRKYDYHKGIDLYCPHNTPVYAVEDSIVVQIRPFTGYKLGTEEYWNDTEALSAVGETGLVVYGEIVPDYHHKVGNVIKRGDLIGWVKTVLKVDKGRPMSMLHLELHAHSVLHTTNHWDGESYVGLEDPSPYLFHSIPNIFVKDKK